MNEEDDVRAIDCPCGHRFEAPELHRSDEQLRARLVADAYDVVTVA